MKHPFLLLLAALAAPCVARAQGIPLTATTPQGFVNRNFQMPQGGLATGDLNGDGRPDAALVLDQVAGSKNADGEFGRVLIVVWGQASGGYRLGLTADGAVMCRTCGGRLGDPFAKLTITNGVLILVTK